MDIEELFTSERHEAGSEMQVRDEHGKLTEMFITVVGVDSKVWRRTEIEMKRALMSGVEVIEATAVGMAKCSLAWRGFKSKGKEIEFTKESVTNVYLHAPYIATQVDAFLSNRANFTKGKGEN